MVKEYRLVATSDKCYFNTDEIALENGLHTFVVKAKAQGFTDSPYSNEVEVEVNTMVGFTFTIENDYQSSWNLYINGELQSHKEGTWENVTKVGISRNDGDELLLLLNDNWDCWLSCSGDGIIVEKELTEDVYIFMANK